MSPMRLWKHSSSDGDECETRPIGESGKIPGTLRFPGATGPKPTCPGALYYRPAGGLRRKTASDLRRAVAGTNGQRLQEFLTRTAWDSNAMDRLRIQPMVAQASGAWGCRSSDTGFAKKGTHSVGVARQYSGELPGRRPLNNPLLALGRRGIGK